MKPCIKLISSRLNLICLSVIMSLSLTLGQGLKAQDADFDEFDDGLADWDPDVSSFQDFGTGLEQENKFYALDKITSKKPLSDPGEAMIAAEDPTPNSIKKTDKDPETAAQAESQEQAPPRTILINFNNVAITEFIRFISRISGKNFIYEENDLQFNVTIVSDEPASLDNVMSALMQILRINDLSLLEQGNSVLIHKNPKVNNISKVVSEGQIQLDTKSTEIITQVFRLNTLDTDQAATLVKPLASEASLIEQVPQTSNLVVTDIATNVQKIGQLLRSLDSPASGLILGQYQLTNGLLDSLIPLAEKIMEPIAEGKPLVLVPHATTNSIFIVSTPFLVERTIAVLRNLDMNTGQTRIFTEESLKFNPSDSTAQGRAAFGSMPGLEGNLNGFGGPGFAEGGAGGLFSPEFDAQGNRLRPAGGLGLGGAAGGGIGGAGATGAAGGAAGAAGAAGGAAAGAAGAGALQSGALGTQSNLDYLQRQQGLAQGSIGSGSSWNSTLPAGHIQRTQFYIQKLKYRRGDQITDALQRIAESLSRTGQSNADLVATIQSIQWIESSNSLVFTGISEALYKVRELIDEIDIPLRQVFIEMLILETTIDDALEYGVNFGARFGGGNQAGAENFVTGVNPLSAGLNTTGVGLTPSAVGMVTQAGYSLGILGQRITHGGTEYASIGALVRATHNKVKSNIILNPKILTEDNVPAEIFVGENLRYQTQAISNDQGSIVTNNFEYRDVGTTLKVTPLISNNDMVTLEIKQEVSRIKPNTNSGVGGLVNLSAGPDTLKNTTTTRVHIPNKYFLIISGMIHEQRDRQRAQIPCLGGAPIIGAMASEKHIDTKKKNMMVFIRPEIIDTEDQIQHLTRHQQNVFRQKKRMPKMWQMETDEAMDWMNIQKPDNCYGDPEEFNP